MHSLDVYFTEAELGENFVPAREYHRKAIHVPIEDYENNPEDIASQHGVPANEPEVQEDEETPQQLIRRYVNWEGNKQGWWRYRKTRTKTLSSKFATTTKAINSILKNFSDNWKTEVRLTSEGQERFADEIQAANARGRRRE